MKNIQHYWRKGFHSGIARRFMLSTIMCSTLLAILITGIQLYIDYRSDLSSLYEDLDNIEESRVPSLINSVWNIDEALINSQLEGILQLDGIEQVEVLAQGSNYRFDSGSNFTSKVEYKYPLIFTQGERHFELGYLQLIVSLDHVYDKLIKRGAIVLLSNSLKTLLVAIFIIIIYQIMVGQHLAHIASFTRSYKPQDSHQHLILQRQTNKPDELTDVETAINQWIDAHKTHVEMQEQAQQDVMHHRDQLSITNEKLNRVNDELKQFSYSASHDLKAPLSSIEGFLHFAKKDIDKGDIKRARYGIEQSMHEAARLSERIEDMLTLAKSEINNTDWELVDIEPIIDKIWGNMQNAYNEKPAKLVKSFTHQLPLFTVSIRLQIILENLLSNALKYAKTDNKITEVKISTEHRADNFILTIADNGIGIPEAQHSKVFKVFQRFANSSRPSSGLGLAIVKKNIDQLGATITFESSPNGTQFIITFPLPNNS